MPFAQRVTTGNPFYPKPGAFCGSMLFYSLNRILGAGRKVTAVVERQQGGEGVPICVDEKNKERLHGAVVRRTDSICLRRALTPHSMSRKDGLFSLFPFLSGTTRKTRWSPFPCDGAISARICLFFRYDSLSRRFILLRRAAGWIPRARVNPTLTPGSPCAAGRTKHRMIPCWYCFPPERTRENDW